MAAPERRATTLFQKLQLSIEIGTIFTVMGLVYWFGTQSAKWDDVAVASKAQAATLEQVQLTTAQVSGQVLQMATTTNLARAEGRISTLETRLVTTDQLVRDLRADMVERLRRIENKIDHVKDNAP